MKKVARLICILLSVTLMGGLLSGCKNKSYDNEKFALVIASDDLDSVFSPFFSSSGADSEVHGQTQIAMLTSDDKGKPYCGEDEPTMAKNYQQTIYINNKSVTEEELIELTKNMTDEEKKGGENYYTEYEFLIKNGVKDSTGTPLTIKDVLFNMYVYLDPMYSGSNTMYSTDIMGLADYRTGIKNVSDSELESFNRTFREKAELRIDDFAKYFEKDADVRKSNRASIIKDGREDQVLADTQTVRIEFWKELNNDWLAAEAAVAEPTNEFKFNSDEGWKYFLANYNIITVERETDGTIKKDDNGNLEIKLNGTENWKHDRLNMIKIVYDNMVGILPSGEKGTPENGVNIDFEINTSTYELGESKLSAEKLREYLSSDDNVRTLNNVVAISRYYATASKVMEIFTLDEKTKYFDSNSNDPVEMVNGISVEKLTAGQTFKGKFGDNAISEDQYVLKIKINAVDPKAIWNFGFAVAPMHYYSNPEARSTAVANKYKNYGYKNFVYPGVDGAPADQTTGIKVGFKPRDLSYMTDVLQAVNKLPIGAGPYRATNFAGKPEDATPNTFFQDGIVYFQRNEYFETTGEEINNAKIKFIRYQVISSTKVVNSLQEGIIHYAVPNAKAEVMNQLNDTSFLHPFKVENNGYGYIGVNARYVSDIQVRRAIMTAMDTTYIKSYYGDLCSIINRPMSKASWAYPEGATDYYPYAEEAGDKADKKERDAECIATIKGLLSQSQFDYKLGGDGVYRFFNTNTSKWEKLKYTFTIAGAEEDHPAYMTFKNATEILAQVGIEAKAVNDNFALSKLSNGQLAVWAAAWSSTIDPDMYQVYHKDSQATSVNNWGYKYMIDEGNGSIEELNIIDELSDLIEEGRSALDDKIRTPIYARALDKVMELAVEYPTYQRDNIVVINTKVIDINSVNTEPNSHTGVFNRIWNVSLTNK